MTEYRIVRDCFLGYEVQSRSWWWPFWVQGRTNTHHTVEAAERYAENLAKYGDGHAGEKRVVVGEEVKRLGSFTEVQ